MNSVLVDNPIFMILMFAILIVMAVSLIMLLVSFKKIDRQYTCPKCGQVHYSTFCSNCGTRITPDTLYCPGCNHIVEPSENYCPCCGTEIKR